MAMSNENGKWVEATPEPYHPSLVEKILHLFGKHTYPLFVRKDVNVKCLICGKVKKG